LKIYIQIKQQRWEYSSLLANMRKHCVSKPEMDYRGSVTHQLIDIVNRFASGCIWITSTLVDQLDLAAVAAKADFDQGRTAGRGSQVSGVHKIGSKIRGFVNLLKRKR